ncbi:MAG TPA: RsmD family RNA methyltransferase, partial [Limnochordales bacterium]
RHTGLESSAEVRVADAVREVERLARQGRRFDLVLMDPPYGQGLAQAALLALGAAGLVAPGGWVVVEHGVREEMPEQAENLAKVRTVRYGDTVLAFFRPTHDRDPRAAEPEPGERREGTPAAGDREGGA